MFWSKNKKNRYTPAYPSYYIKVGSKGFTLHGYVFLMFNKTHLVDAVLHAFGQYKIIQSLKFEIFDYKHLVLYTIYTWINYFQQNTFKNAILNKAVIRKNASLMMKRGER